MILHGDSLELLKTLPENSVDAVVCDPPYGLSFMGKKWDYDVPSSALWTEVLRVLKPGGLLLSFGGTRTYHRMAVAIEDAGFEIRDMLSWLYGSGFPKSMNVAIAIDKQAGAMKARGKAFRTAGAGEREDIQDANGTVIAAHEPITDLAKRWQGWGTALKPANEPIVLARKPLSESTVAKNVKLWGTGALNIDGTRIGTSDSLGRTPSPHASDKFAQDNTTKAMKWGTQGEPPQGRWPANVLFDEEAAAMLDEQSGVSKSGGGKSSGKTFHGQVYVKDHNERPTDSGGASRFFYVAKASKRERNAGLEGMPTKHVGTYAQDEWSRQNMGNTPDAKRAPVANHHPTVKPIKLMEYLCKLICPPGGVLLDPFMGSGSTLVAATRLGFKCIGIEREAEYVEIARRRIEHASEGVDASA